MIASGPVIQVAWVTDDLEATEVLLSEQFGVGAWTRIPDVEFGADTTTLRGEPVSFTAHISLGYAADLQLELIEPVSGPTIHAEFLAANGPGLHHVCFAVDDIEAACEAAEAAGVPVLMRGLDDGWRDRVRVRRRVGIRRALRGAGEDRPADAGVLRRREAGGHRVNDATGRVAVVTGAGVGSLGEATSQALRALGFRVLTSTRTCETTGDTHAMELASRQSVQAFADWVADRRRGSTCWSTTPASTSTCAPSGPSRNWWTDTRCTGGPTTWAPPS